jgi:putative endopeptidase
MLVLVGNLIKAYAASIEELDWMSEETKVEALDKLSKFTPKIGYPDIWKAYADLEIDALDYFGNRERSRLVEYQRDIEKIGGPIQKHEWGMTPQTVNAYYSPALNEIVFPAAILQPPFFDLSVDNAVNYGAIGAVIGHEIGHGFDDSGSAFDGDGVLRNWWTDADKAEFEKRTAALIAQYDEFKVFDDLNVNGTFTLGENIGDLGGLSIALKAYKMTLDGETPEVIDGFTGVQRVFIGYAQAWLRKDREERLRQQVGTDPHSPARFRVNGVVRNVPEFYEAFDVQESDALYLAPEERVKIW